MSYAKMKNVSVIKYLPSFIPPPPHTNSDLNGLDKQIRLRGFFRKNESFRLTSIDAIYPTNENITFQNYIQLSCFYILLKKRVGLFKRTPQTINNKRCYILPLIPSTKS